MWLSYSVCEVVGILLTLFVGLALSADETGDLARGRPKLLFAIAWFLYFWQLLYFSHSIVSHTVFAAHVVRM